MNQKHYTRSQEAVLRSSEALNHAVGGAFRVQSNSGGKRHRDIEEAAMARGIVHETVSILLSMFMI